MKNPKFNLHLFPTENQSIAVIVMREKGRGRGRGGGEKIVIITAVQSSYDYLTSDLC